MKIWLLKAQLEILFILQKYEKLLHSSDRTEAKRTEYLLLLVLELRM